MSRQSASLLHKKLYYRRKKEREHLLITPLSVFYIMHMLYFRREVEEKKRERWRNVLIGVPTLHTSYTVLQCTSHADCEGQGEPAEKCHVIIALKWKQECEGLHFITVLSWQKNIALVAICMKFYVNNKKNN